MILDTIALKDNDCVNSDIDDETKEDAVTESPIRCVTTLPSTDLKPTVTIHDNVHPEVLYST